MLTHNSRAALIVSKRGAWSASMKGASMAAMKPRTGDGPLEVTKEGRGIVMRVPLEGGGRLVVEMTPDEANALGDALKSATGLRPVGQPLLSQYGAVPPPGGATTGGSRRGGTGARAGQPDRTAGRGGREVPGGRRAQGRGRLGAGAA